MQKLIKKLLKDNSLTIAISVTILIAILSLLKLGKQPIQISNLDKIEHALAYCVLSLFWFVALRKKYSVYIIAVFCLIYGIIIEVFQAKLTSYRSAEFEDAIANGLGILIALVIFKTFITKSKLFKE